MTDFVIEELIPPDSLDGPGGDDFRELIDVRNQIETEALGTDALAATPESIFPHFTSTPQKGRRHFVVRDGGRIVARGWMGWLTAADAPAATITTDVLPSYRRRGIGSALFTHLEQIVAEMGRKVIQASVIHTSSDGGERVVASTGFGDVPANDAGVQFLQRHGYGLEQVARISRLDLTDIGPALEEQRRAAQEKAGPDYRIIEWVGRTPEKWLEQRAALSTAMSVDEPSGGLEVIADVWDANRVREHDDRQQGTGRTLYIAAAEHVPTGTLVAHTELGRLEGSDMPAVQEDTLVLRAHRGHRLGMLLKAINAQQLLRQAPDTPEIITFNVEENEPMLRVNIEMGFTPIGAEGEWQKRV